MAINLDKLVGFHQNALKIRNDKMEVIAGNLANANTPGYKSRGIDFQKAMAQAQQICHHRQHHLQGLLQLIHDKLAHVQPHHLLAMPPYCQLFHSLL